MSALTYRVYGPSHGPSSFRAVTCGFLEGLEALQREAVFCPTDLYSDEEAERRGATADVGIWCGWTAGIEAMARARHKRRFVMVAPNSTASPPFVFDACKAAEAEILTPSAWGKHVIAAQTGLRAAVVPHGVLAEFQQGLLDRALPARRDPRGGCRMLHVTSTTGKRKGTRELLIAWQRLVDTGVLRSKAPDTLTIACDEAAFSALAESLPMGAPPGVLLRVPCVPEGGMRDFYRDHDLVVQPSRAEGFGMTPLEAAAAGVPTVATACTGHQMWIGQTHTIAIPFGPLGPADDYEGSEMPTVDPNDIARSLVIATSHLIELQESTEESQRSVFARWRWPEAIRPFIERIEKEAA